MKLRPLKSAALIWEKKTLQLLFAKFSSAAALFLLPALITPAHADSSADRISSVGVQVVDQLVSVAFDPVGAYLLIEQGLGAVARIRAEYIPYFVAARLEPGAESEPAAAPVFRPNEPRKVVVGSAVPVDILKQGEGRFHFSFFLTGPKSTFAATPVKRSSAQELEPADLTVQAMSREIEKIEEDYSSRKKELEGIEDRLSSLRSKASAIAGVDEIVDLKMELSKLKGYGQEKAVETERLKTLIESGRKQKDTRELDPLKSELSVHLRDVAGRTANADRLEQRKQDSARTSLNQKMELVREMEGEDAEALAREMVKLRAKKKELESKLGKPSVAAPDNEF